MTTPFDYMKSMAELWGQGGKNFAAAQQKFFAEMGKGGAEAFQPASMFDQQAVAQANEAFGKLWSSALEMSQTISRNMQGGEKQSPVVEELLGKIFDPRAWFSGPSGMDQALQKMAEGPQLADIWNTERKMLNLFNAWTALRRRSVEHNTVMLEAWLAAAGKFAKDLNEKADRKEALGSWRDVLALWVETANTALLETQGSERYLKSQREILKASTDLRLAQQEMAELYSQMFGYPTREELDDVHRTVTELRRDMRALQRAARGTPKKEKPAKASDQSWDQYAPNRSSS